MQGVCLKPAYTLLSDCNSGSYHGSESKLLCVLAFNLNSLRFHSLSRRPCSLAVALHTRSHGLAVGVDIQSSWNIWMRWSKIYGKWLVQTNKHTHVCNAATLVWGSLSSRPNNYWLTGFTKEWDWFVYSLFCLTRYTKWWIYSCHNSDYTHQSCQ